MDEQAGGSSSMTKHKTVQSKNVNYSVSIKEKQIQPAAVTPTQEFLVDLELRPIFDLATSRTATDQFIIRLLYTQLDSKAELKQGPLVRKLLDLIKKKYKDDLMENLLLEEYCNIDNPENGGGQ